MKIDTLRLIITLDCNLNCPYCCNKKPEINSRFIRKKLSEIDFDKYKNICITGGEPFINSERLYEILLQMPVAQKFYLYTNGILIDREDIFFLEAFGFAGINIGLHYQDQINEIPDFGDMNDRIRFHIQDKKVDEFIAAHPDRLNRQNVKPWKMDECERPNEDWVLLGC